MTEVEANPVAIVAELGLLLAGLALLWRHVLSPASRRTRPPAQLAAWDIAPADFLVFLLLVVCGGLAFSVFGGLLVGQLHLKGAARTVLGGGAFQFGLLAGVATHTITTSRRLPRLLPAPSDLISGATTFLIALPIATGVSLGWTELLKLAGLPAERQELVDLFTHLGSPLLLACMIGLATLVAPLTEECVFRAGLFRYFRTRLPRWSALLLPGVIFASLHVNWATGDGLASFGPLVALAVIFSLAYERTGRIGTAIVAHGLFNLHTIGLIFAGFAP